MRLNKGKMESCPPLPGRHLAPVLWNSNGPPFCGKQKGAGSQAQGTDGHASTGTFQLSHRHLLPNRPPSPCWRSLPLQCEAELWRRLLHSTHTSASHPQHPAPDSPADQPCPPPRQGSLPVPSPSLFQDRIHRVSKLEPICTRPFLSPSGLKGKL